MVRQFFKKIFKGNSFSHDAIDPDEIFLDSSNLPEFDRHQMEGRIEKPISSRSIFFVGIAFTLIAVSFISRLWFLQVVNGDTNANKAENNRLRQTHIFAERGIIYDRNNIPLAWNDSNLENPDFSLRKYATTTGLSHVLGYVKYPTKDSAGFYFRDEMIGVAGIEEFDNQTLAGINGLRIIETDALGKITSESLINPPQHGQNVVLSIDAAVQSELYTQIKNLAGRVGFMGGAGVIMDVHTGEVIAMTSFPEYSSQVMTDGKDREEIARYNKNPSNPFLDKVTSGLYTPGSIVKPFMSIAALEENIISPRKQILSTGSITIPNPYSPGNDSVFRDWKAHGWVDMYKALAVSSDVYFYAIGGGYEDQKGLGIQKIDSYMRMFGFGKDILSPFFKDKVGTIPNPEWKKANFDGEEWRIGNTYHTVIGQYGFQVTPIQAVRAVASIANGGILVEPTIIKDKQGQEQKLSLQSKNIDVAGEGMRLAVTEGIAQAINFPFVKVAAKTGTAELGVSKQQVNSWITGYFPYESPRYAFAVIMEKGHRDNLTGAVFVMQGLLNWMQEHKPEYLK